MKLTPWSRAWWMIRTQSSWSGFPQAPNIIAPRQYGLTRRPVEPRVRKSSMGRTLRGRPLSQSVEGESAGWLIPPPAAPTQDAVAMSAATPLSTDRPRVGGQALADGVLMRTSHAWAVARAGGSVEVGPFPKAHLTKVPVVRVLAGLGPALAMGVRALANGAKRKGGLQTNRGARQLLI